MFSAISVLRMPRLNTCNWPELSRYCGFFRLSTGIYIRSVVSLVLVSVMITFNAFGLRRVLTMKESLNGVSITVIGERFNATVTEDDLHMVRNILAALKVYIIIWNILKIVYILNILIALYAIFFNKPRILKVAFYIMIPNWIFDIVMLIGAKTFLRLPFQLLFLIGVGTELYNLIAINSQYKQMAFKSRIVPEDVLTTTTSTHTHMSPTDVWNPSTYGGAHCRTCVCNTSPYMETRSERTTVTTLPSPQTPTEPEAFGPPSTEEDKNFKDGPIIFNQDQLQGPSDILFIRSPRLENEDERFNVRLERDARTDRRDLERARRLELGDSRTGRDERNNANIPQKIERNDTRRPRRPNSLAL
ncbi:unnamed protein product [Leptosia nina]|uniref:Uncharacterized protein n=1 Tax=Leptosia nina TaxID=320188 RepID=A0AAV1J0A0_9NEOP